MLGHLNEISIVDFDHMDVVRHPLVSKIVKAYSDQNNEMIKANVILDNKKWQKYIKNPSIYIKKKFNKLSKFKDFKKKKEFSIMLTDNKKMKYLNKKFRKKNMPTDVLSFPIKNLLNNKKYIGDIAISYEIINKRSKKSNFLY